MPKLKKRGFRVKVKRVCICAILCVMASFQHKKKQSVQDFRRRWKLQSLSEQFAGSSFDHLCVLCEEGELTYEESLKKLSQYKETEKAVLKQFPGATESKYTLEVSRLICHSIK
jgi:hypothetical protein